jgi:hypothetical protein
VLIGGCPSSSFPWCQNHPPLEVVGHSGWLFMFSKGRSDGGTSRGLQCSMRGNNGVFGRAARPPQDLAPAASMIEDASHDVGSLWKLPRWGLDAMRVDGLRGGGRQAHLSALVSKRVLAIPSGCSVWFVAWRLLSVVCVLY